MQHIIFSQPLYAKSAVRLALCAFAALVMISCSYFATDYASLAHTNAIKIINVRHALAGAAARSSANSFDAAGHGQSLAASLLEDETLRQNSASAIAFIQAAVASPNNEAAALQLQSAEQAIWDEARAVQRAVKWIEFVSFAGILCLLTVLAWDLQGILTSGRMVPSPHDAPAASAAEHQSSPAINISTPVEQPATGLQPGAADKKIHDSELTALHLRTIRAHDYLGKIMTSAIEPPFRTSMLLKMLFALERALDLENTAILFSEDSGREPSERCLFSHHEPRISQPQLRSAILKGDPASVIEMPADETALRTAGVAFVDQAGELSVLLVEYKRDRALRPFEAQTLRATASLLSIIAKLDGHDQEARRVALLEERAAIARELHDSLAQSLAYMKIQLARLQSYQGTGETDNKTQINDVTSELREGLDNAYKELRGLLSTFRVHMDARGLDFAIASAIEEFTQRSGIAVSLDNRLMGVPLTVNEEFHVLQVVRESLSNILHHASANNVSIVMAPQGNKAVVITIDDDGIGYTPLSEGQTTHHGQTIMKERAFNLGGFIDVAPRSDHGTRVKLTFTPKKSQ